MDTQKLFVIKEIHASLEFTSMVFIAGLQVEMAHFELSFSVKNVICWVADREQRMGL